MRRRTVLGRSRAGLLVLLAILAIGHALGAAAPADAQVGVVGEWRTLPQTSPINPIHVALLRTGRVLIVAGSENDPTVTTNRAALWDPATGGNLQYNPFRGIRTATIFDPATEAFAQVQDMARGRWYPSNVALGDGRTMTFSGWLETGGTNNAVELYSVPGGWSAERLAPFTPPLYPWLHLLPDGRVFQSGAQVSSHIFNPGPQTWATGVARTAYPSERTYGSSVLLPLRPTEGHRARIMIMGGDNPATDTAEIIDLSQGSPAWRSLPPMSAPRIQMNAVLLPTGKVLALGGSAQNNTAGTASLDADLFDPDSETWSPAGRMARARMYHSVALLLPDATVWVAGSNPQQGSWDSSMEIYRPAYLFTPGGAPAARPSIAGAPAAVGYNAAFQVTTPNAADIASVALVRPGSATHAFDFEQRVVNLAFTAGSGTLTLTSPPSANVAPPGYYMLFLINRAGVPSVARWVQVSPSPGNQPPRGAINTPSGDVTIRAGESVSFAGSGTDTDGTVTGFAWSFPGGTPASSTSASPGGVTFATPGTFDVTLVVTDNGGASDPSPPRRRITVLAAGLTAGFTAPAAGATVAGTQPVTMTVDNAAGSSNTFTLTIDGVQVFTTTTAATSASFSWDTRPYPDGAHTLALTVTDADGATATATRSVTINNTGTPGNEIHVSFPGLSPGQTVRGLATVRIVAADTAGASNRFSIMVDGVVRDTVLTNASTIDWAWNTMGLTNGSHTVTATVTDATGRTGTGSEYVNVHNTLRVFITSPAVSATVSGIAWVDVWVEGVSGTANAFTLLVGDTVVASGSSSGRHVTLPWDTRQTPNGTRTLFAQVRDAANNGGQDTRAFNVQNAGGGPSAAFTTPAAGATVSGTVSVGLAASGGTGPYTYRLTIDGAQVFTTSAGASATYAWNTTAVANGSHTLGLTVTDAAGAVATATRTLTVQNTGGTPLGASFTSPAAGVTVSGPVAVGMAASGGTAPYTFRLAIDGTQVFTTTGTATSASYSWNTTTATNGPHTLGLTITDSAGLSATATRSVTVANSAGTLRVALTTPAAGSTVSGTGWVNVWLEGAVAGSKTYTLTVGAVTVGTENSTATHVTLPWTTTSTPHGPQTLVASVRDAAGNTGSGSVGVTVQNGTAPALAASLTSPAAGATVNGTVTVGLAATGGRAPYTYRLTVDGAQVFTTSGSATSASFAWNTTAVSNGAHTLGLTVTDAAGASASATRTVTVSNTTGGGSFSVFLTTPSPGDTASGTVWVNVWVEGAATGTRAFTMTVSGTTVWSESSSDNHVSLPWVTTNTPNGTRTLVVTVRDAAGAT